MKRNLQISIPHPCHEPWSRMDPTAHGAFCHSCQKEVTDFSAMTESEIIAHLDRHGMGCGRFKKIQLDPVLAFPKKENRVLFPLLLSGLMLASCSQQKMSPEILNAYKTVNQSIVRSNTWIDAKNDKVVKLIESERKEVPEKIEILMPLVIAIRGKSSDLNAYIQNLIVELNKSDYDVDMAGKDGTALKSKLEKYKADITALMKEYPLPAEIPIDVSSSKKEEILWQKAFFHELPKVAALAMLSKLENDVKNTEAMCLDRLAKESIPIVGVVLDKFEPLVCAKSSYIQVGDMYEATIGMGAYSTAIEPEIYVDRRKMDLTDAKATYTVATTAAGTFKVPYLVKIPKRDGGFEELRGEMVYTVGTP